MSHSTKRDKKSQSTKLDKLVVNLKRINVITTFIQMVYDHQDLIKEILSNLFS
jgi:hypothetical protein